MIDRCRTCGHSQRRHYHVIEWPDGTKEFVHAEIEAYEVLPGYTLVCMRFEPTYHVEGVL